MIPSVFQFHFSSVCYSLATTYKIQWKVLNTTLKGGNLTFVKSRFNFDNIIELYESENKMSHTFVCFLLDCCFYRMSFHL